MDNLDKVIDGLECCQYDSKSHCDGCPYNYNAIGHANKCTADLTSDALDLFNEKDEKIKTLEARIDKVIKGLERCLKGTCPAIASTEYEECEYTDGLYCRKDKLIFDALEILNANKGAR